MSRFLRFAPSPESTHRLLSLVTVLCGIGVVTLLPAVALGVILGASPMRPPAQTALCAAALSGAAWGLLGRRAADAVGPACALAMSVMYGALATGGAWSSAALALQPERALIPSHALGLVAAGALAGLPGFFAMHRALVRLLPMLLARRRP